MAADLKRIVHTVRERIASHPFAASAILRKAVRRTRAAATHPANKDVADRLLALAAQFESAIPAREREPADPLSLDELQKPLDPAAVSDFAELLDDHEEARAEAEAAGDPHADLAVAARTLRRQAARGAATENSTNRVAPWPDVGTDKIGNQAVVTYNPSFAQQTAGILGEASVIMWQGTKEESTSFTVDIEPVPTSVQPSPNPATGVSLRPYAKVVIGADGFLSPPFLCDVGAGVRFTAAGNFCSVAVGMAAPSIVAFPPSAVATIGARLGFYASPSTQPLTFTSYLDLLVASGSPGDHVIIVRPQRAAACTLLTVAAATGATLEQMDTVGNVIAELTWSSTTPTLTPWPLANDCAAVRVKNTSNVQISARLIWELSL